MKLFMHKDIGKHREQRVAVNVLPPDEYQVNTYKFTQNIFWGNGFPINVKIRNFCQCSFSRSLSGV